MSDSGYSLKKLQMVVTSTKVPLDVQRKNGRKIKLILIAI